MRLCSLFGFVVGLMASGAVQSAPSHSVHGYVKRDGTYVAPHMQTNPNSTKLDNYSTKGNVNPYTGKPGTVDPDRIVPVLPYTPK